MFGSLDHLDRGKVAHFGRYSLREQNLRQTDGAWVGVVGGPHDLERRDHRVAHVRGSPAHAEVDVDKGCGVALEPAGLEGDGTAADGPFGAVLRGGHAAAWRS